MNNFKHYAQLPEMRLTWLFLFLTAIMSTVNFFFLDVGWAFLTTGTLLAMSAIIFYSALQSALRTRSLRLEKIQADSIVASIGDGIVIYDTDFRITGFNAIAEQIFNLPASQIINQIFSLESIKQSQLQILTQVIFPTMAPTVVRKSDPNVFPQIVDLSFENPRLELRVITNQFLDSDGSATGFIKIIRDRTREMELLKSKSDFITVAAHQLRTPLSAISWTFESLKKEKIDASQLDLVNIGASAANNLSKTVESLLNVSKIEEGRFGYTFKTFDVVRFLGDLLSQAEPIAREYKTNLYFDGPRDEVITITGDTDKLSIAISNLLDNAIKYNVQNGQVIVQVQQLTDKPFIRIAIKDTAIGIPQEDLGKLFTKFFRSTNVVHKETAGSGLGLYIVKNIILRHGGEVWVESELNRGTIFYFTLPTDPKLIPQKELIYEEE